MIIPTIADGVSTKGVIHYIETVERTYNEICKQGEGSRIMRGIFGDMPVLTAVFYNMVRAANYETEKRGLKEQLKSMKFNENVILDIGVGNYIDIARSVSKGQVINGLDKCLDDFESTSGEIIERIKNGYQSKA